MCGGQHCVRVERHRLRLLKAGSYPQRLFAEGSPFLGTTVRWVNNEWEWNVANTTAADAAHIRKLISFAGTTQATLERLTGAGNARVQHFAKEWGLV